MSHHLISVARRHYFLLLIFLTCCSLLTRILFLNSLPSELHRDEANIAYNAYSILKTGKDEHGKSYPVIFESFGDYKLPVMVYLTEVSIALKGLEPGVVRVPNALLATLLIPAFFGLSYELFKRKQTALCASAVLTFSVWHTFLARTIYEPIAGLTFSTIGLYFLLKARHSSVWFIPAALFFLIACFTYNLPMLFIPLIVVASALIFRKEYHLHSLQKFSGFLLVGVAFLIPFLITLPLAQQKSGATLFSNQQLLDESQANFAALIRQRVPYKISVVLTNRYSTGLTQFVANYAAVWNPQYLFIKGNDNPWHSLQLIRVGSFHWGAIPFILIGMLLLIRRAPKWSKSELLILIYLLFSPVINSLTLDSPNTNRLMDFHLAVTLILAIGLSWTIDQLRFSKNRQIKVFLCLLIGYYLMSWSNAMMKYTLLHSSHLDIKWHEGVEKASQTLAPLLTDVDIIYVDASNLPDYYLLYTEFAFYTKLDPQVFQNTAQWDKQFSFLAPHQFANYRMILPFKIDNLTNVDTTQYFPPGVNTVIFVKRLSPSDTISSYHTAIINNYKGEPIWEVAKVTKQEIEDRLHPAVLLKKK
ncbi:MAG: hypothetical protein ABI425_02135 [Patescibacteria group bacterium]